MISFKKIFLCLSMTLVSNISFGENYQNQNAVEYGKQQAHQSLASLGKDVHDIQHVEKALRQNLNVAIYNLKHRGYIKEAQQITQEWAQISAYYFQDSANLLKLGDHKPLSQWIAKTYDRIEDLLGKRFCKLVHLDDIKAINYGFPVVIHPEGDPETNLPWGEEEYLNHFIPYTTATVYWSGTVACSVALNLVGSLICGVALEIPRYGIYHYIAPALGEKIYQNYNQ
ncbi:MAG: hypothetical protein ACXWR0_07760 [Bdellovibrio sp.]